MKPKTKTFINKLVSDPKISATQAYLDTHTTTNRNSAKASASKLLTSPNVQIYLNEHIERARNRIVDLVSSNKEEIALRASDSILDRSLGKPTQRLETNNQVVSINIDLTSDPYPPPSSLAHRFHLSCIYIERKCILWGMDKKLANKYDGLVKSADDWFLLYVFNDTDFQNEVASANRADYPKIAQKYNIRLEDINLYRTQSIMAGGIIPKKSKVKIVHYDETKQIITVQLPYTVSKAEFNDLWKKISILQPHSRQKRRKSIEHPKDLVYAIFKQRQKNVTMAKIFVMYDNDKLPGYSGPSNLLEAEFRKYYSRNFPGN